MPIEASIAMGFKAPQFESPMNALAQVLQVQQAQQQNQLGTMKMDEYKRGVEDKNALRAALAAPDADPYKVLLQRGDIKGATDFQKGQADLKKSGAETEKTQLEAAHKKISLAGQILGTAKDQASWDAARASAQSYGLDVSKMPPQFDPGFVQSKIDESMDLKTKLEQKWKAMEYTTPNANAVLSANTSRENNKATVGASYANASATREIAKATRDAASIQRDQATEMKLADDYRSQSKGFKEVADAHKQIVATLDKATTSPAATLAAATKFMKLLDPGSVVRESELGMALAATGVLDRLTNYHNTLQHGKVLTPNQVKDFKDITGKIYGAAQSAQQQIDTSYKGTANAYKLRPEMVVQDLGQNTPAGGSKPGAVAPNVDALIKKYSK